jgi:predicted ATPase
MNHHASACSDAMLGDPFRVRTAVARGAAEATAAHRRIIDRRTRTRDRTLDTGKRCYRRALHDAIECDAFSLRNRPMRAL